MCPGFVNDAVNCPDFVNGGTLPGAKSPPFSGPFVGFFSFVGRWPTRPGVLIHKPRTVPPHWAAPGLAG